MKTFHSIIIFCFSLMLSQFSIPPCFSFHQHTTLINFPHTQKNLSLSQLLLFQLSTLTSSFIRRWRSEESLLAVNCNLIISIFLLKNFSLRTYSLIHLLCCIIIGNFLSCPTKKVFSFIMGKKTLELTNVDIYAA